MKLRVTELLDDYQDVDLPLDPVPVPEFRRIKEVTMKRIESKRHRPLRMLLIAAAIVALLAGTAVAAIYYTNITNRMEANWNALGGSEMTQEQKDFVESKSASINESVTDNGVTVTIDSVTCAEDKVWVLYRIESDVEDVRNTWRPTAYVTTAGGEVIEATVRGGSGSLDENGSRIFQQTYEFPNLPENVSLTDGTTTMTVEITELYALPEAGQEDEGAVFVEGQWIFSFLLPESETAASVSADATLNFESGVVLTLHGIAVSESGCSFSVEANSDEYSFVESNLLELVKAAEPELQHYAVTANLSTGGTASSGGVHMSYNEDTGEDDWSIEWSAPLDPAQVVSLVFTDGDTEQIVPVNS